MINNQLNIADLIISYLKGTISDKEMQFLNEWRETSSENEKLFERLSLKSSYIVKAEQLKSFESQNRFQEISKTIKRGKIRLLYKYSSIAAAMLLPVIIFFTVLRYPKEEIQKSIVAEQITPGKPTAVLHTSEGSKINLEKGDFEIKNAEGANIVNKGNSLVYNKGTLNTKDLKEKINSVEVPRGGEYNLTLSDGTKVWLNSESSIKYPVRFIGKKRIVRVSGEVYFDVKHDDSKPFIVVAGENKVEVLGTEFNVRAYEDEVYVATTLVEGKVRTWGKDKKASILKPSQQCIYTKSTGKSIVSKVDIEQYTAWKSGLFVFNSQSLEDILNTLSKWYDVQVFFEQNSLRNIVFSGRLKRYDNAESLLGVFEQMEDVKFYIKGKTIYVRKK